MVRVRTGPVEHREHHQHVGDHCRGRLHPLDRSDRHSAYGGVDGEERQPKHAHGHGYANFPALDGDLRSESQKAQHENDPAHLERLVGEIGLGELQRQGQHPHDEQDARQISRDGEKTRRQVEMWDREHYRLDVQPPPVLSGHRRVFTAHAAACLCPICLTHIAMFSPSYER